MQRTFLFAVMLGLPGCSLALDFGTEVRTVDTPCIASDTCPDDAKCAVMLDDNNVRRLACAPAGDVPLHGRCAEAVPGGRADDCERDHHCFRNTCYPLSPTCNANESVITFMIDTVSLDICVPNCDVLTAPTCPASLGCYLATDRLSSAGFCHVVGTTAQGQSCTQDIDCPPTQDCPADRNICTALCPPPFNQYCVDGNFGTLCTRNANDLVGECTP